MKGSDTNWLVNAGKEMLRRVTRVRIRRIKVLVVGLMPLVVSVVEMLDRCLDRIDLKGN